MTHWDMESLPEESCGGLGGLHARKGNVHKDGGCNFCCGERSYRTVTVVNGHHLQVRFCNSCLKKLKEQTR